MSAKAGGGDNGDGGRGSATIVSCSGVAGRESGVFGGEDITGMDWVVW